MKKNLITRRMKATWDALATQNAMYFIATEREDWELESFLESGRTALRTIMDDVGEPISPSDGVAVDLGCGIGRISFSLADFYAHVIGIDVSKVMVTEANLLKEKLGRNNVTFYFNDGHTLDMIGDSTCQFAFSYIVLQHVPDPHVVLNYIREMARVVKPGGNVLFQVPVYRDSVRVRYWRFLQILFRAALWPLEAVRLVPPEKGVAFRGTRVRMHKLNEVIQSSHLIPLKIHISDSTYRFCDDVVIYCKKLQ